jgi:hypothetical protein
MRSMGLLILLAGGVLVLIGLILIAADKLPFLGHLPGDIRLRGKNITFSFPLTTCIVLSVVLTLIVNLLLRFFRR